MKVEFRSDDHTYWSDGEQLPGVTTVIETVCQSFANVPEQYLIPAQERGTAVHRATELDDLEMLDEDTLDADLHPYLSAWRSFKGDVGFEPERIESVVAHPVLRYAGTLDRTGRMTWRKARRLVLLDIKTGPPVRGTALQLAAYHAALLKMYGQDIKTRISVHLSSNGSYRIKEYTNPSDMRVFTAMLTAYRWMKETK